MTLKEFIKTIKTAGNIPSSLDDIAIELYEYSGLCFSDNTIKAVLHEKRSPNCVQGSICEAGFIRYFEERTSSTWKEMQGAFSELDQCGFVDRDTDDRNIFYESLLTLFYDIFRSVPVSLHNILPSVPLIFGRAAELEQLADIFKTSNYAIITGIGGIGKSCMALAYAHDLKKNCIWTAQHIICENTDTLPSAIIKLQFDGLADSPKNKKNADKENLKRRILCLKNSRKHMLIILDNLNRPFTEDDHDILKKLIECGNHVRVLITSRNTLTDVKQCVVHMPPLNDNALLELYAYHRFENPADHKDYIVQHKDILLKLFSIVGKHTLMVELLAKLPSRIFVNEYEIYDRLVSGCGISLEGISTKKDGETIKLTHEGLVKILFNSSNLTDCEKSVMRYMSIIPPTGINVRLFEELTRHPKKELIGLKEAHWIMMDEECLTIRLHPLICETILSFEDTKPTVENCAEVIDRIKKKLDLLEESSPQRYVLSKIMICFAQNVHFRAAASLGIFDYLRDEIRENLLFISKVAIRYINADSLEEWTSSNTLLDRNNEVNK